jgi:hypothetical protein
VALLIPKVLRGQILAFVVLGMLLGYDFLGIFLVSRKLEGLFVKLKNTRFGPLL